MKKIILSLFIFLPLFSFAASSHYVLLEPLPCIQNTGQGDSDTACAEGTMIKEIKAETYIAYIYNFSIAFAAVAAVVVIIYAGFEYALSDIVTKKSDAKARIGNAIWGLITIISSYFILETIDPRLVNIDTQLPPIKITGVRFNYEGLLQTADERINKDLSDALESVKPLEAEAKILRAEAAEYRKQAAAAISDPEKSGALQVKAAKAEQNAIELEREAKRLTSDATLKAGFDKVDAAIDSISGGTITQREQEEIDLRKQELINVNNRNIETVKKAGDIEGVKILENKQEFYLEQLDQNLYFERSLKAAQETVLEYNTVEGARDSATIKSLIEDVKKYNTERNFLSAEENAILAAEKANVVKKLEDLIKPQ